MLFSYGFPPFRHFLTGPEGTSMGISKGVNL
jgi:hypothetical protein